MPSLVASFVASSAASFALPRNNRQSACAASSAGRVRVRASAESAPRATRIACSARSQWCSCFVRRASDTAAAASR